MTPKVLKRCIENDVGSKVKVTGSQSAKHIEGDRMVSVSYAVYRVVYPASGSTKKPAGRAA